MSSIKLAANRGFTLVEALVASIVLALCLFAMGVAVYAEFAFINQNREKAIATLAAQEEIEKLRGMPFDTILAQSSYFTASGFAYLKNPVGRLTIENIYSGGANMKSISVRVRWDSLTGRILQKSLVTIMTRNGINKQ